jgi:hypothetical protein
MPESATGHVRPIILVESNLSRSLHVFGVLVESSIRAVLLLLHGSAELHKLFRHWLVCCLKDVDQTEGVVSCFQRAYGK